MNEVAARFEGFEDYGRYGRGLWRAYRRRAARLLADRLGPPPWRVLDLGGGSLLSLPELVEDPRVASWTVVDLVDRLGARPPRVSVVVGDAARFIAEHRGEPFDAVVCFGLLMYLKPDASRALLAGLGRVVKPGALLLSHEPRARAAAGLDAGIERPVDVSAEAAPGGWLPVLAERHNHPLFWGAAARFGPAGLWEGSLGSAVLAAESRLDGGLDALTLLRRG